MAGRSLLKSEPVESAPAPAAAGKSGSRWRRRLLCVAVITCAAACCHRWILRSVAEFLVIEEPRAGAQAVLLAGGESQFDVAAQEHARGAKVIWLRRGLPDRLERLGIVGSAEANTRRELQQRGIPADDVSSLADEPVDNSRVGEVLCDWLRRHPDSQINVLCDRFSTRKWRLMLRRSAAPDCVSRIHLVSLPYRSFDETNWWQSKPGQRTILNGYLKLFYTWWHAHPSPAGRELSPADFEDAFARKAGP